MKDGGKKNKQDSIKANIYSKYPALKNMGDVVLEADTTFTRKKTGVGDIEFFNPDKLEGNVVRYNSGYVAQNPNPSGFGIRYNPKTNNEQSIMLDMLHGMPNDPKYAEHRESFKNAFLNSEYKGDLEREWNRYDKKTKGKNDGKEQFTENWIDGKIRNLMFKGTSDDYKKARYWQGAKKEYFKNEDIKESFNDLVGYLKTPQNSTQNDPTEYKERAVNEVIRTLGLSREEVVKELKNAGRL